MHCIYYVKYFALPNEHCYMQCFKVRSYSKTPAYTGHLHRNTIWYNARMGEIQSCTIRVPAFVKATKTLSLNLKRNCSVRMKYFERDRKKFFCRYTVGYNKLLWLEVSLVQFSLVGTTPKVLVVCLCGH